MTVGRTPHIHHPHHAPHEPNAQAVSLNQTALMATLHCVTGCTIGEVLGMALGTARGWSNWPTVGLAVALAFFFGYAMTMYPLRRAGMAWARVGARASLPSGVVDGSQAARDAACE